ncbi:MAG TPA: VRR-NUC domain-containing protein [Pyrinomonadaceae bacterium]
MRYLSHQINRGEDSETQDEVPVTLGFQDNVCNTCRGLPAEAHPAAAIQGRTSKIARYYWREIAFETTPRFAEWAEKQGYADWLDALIAHQDQYRIFEKEVKKEIKELHERSPKYVYRDTSQSEVLARYDVDVIRLEGTYVKNVERGALIVDGNTACSAEEFASRYFQRQGYESLLTESRPFHVLFATFMWMLIQDADDPNVRLVAVPSREGTGEMIWTLLPADFGTRAYSHRRDSAITNHISELPDNKSDLLWLFDYWLGPSEGLRQYLWAHYPKDIETARKILTILPVTKTIQILRYLVTEYWQLYCGWPDALFYKQDEFFFAEIKSSKDVLSEDQKNWIKGNATELRLPFKLIKIHKVGTVDS